MKWFSFGLIVALSGALVGCGGDETAGTTGATTPPASSSAARPVQQPNADAGVRVDPTLDPNVVKGWVASKTVSSRKDPFALLPAERAWDQKMTSERLVSENGGWSMRYEEQPEPEPVDITQPQPYRRLAGVLIGDTVSAIIVMENGRSEIIRPGMRIPNSEWTVVSIDEDVAVLKRDGNVKPTQIVVNLEVAPMGGAPAGGGNAGGGRGNQGGGGTGGEDEEGGRGGGNTRGGGRGGRGGR